MCIFLKVLCSKFHSDNFKFLFTEWSRETLLDKWMINPVQCCQSAGVQPPPSSSYADTGVLCLTRSINSASVIEESNSCDEEEPEETDGCKDSPKSPGKCSTLVTEEEPSEAKGEMEVIYQAFLHILSTFTSRILCLKIKVFSSNIFQCSICLQFVSLWVVLPKNTMSCGHTFCSLCWENYLTLKIQEGDAHHISCPEYNCDILVPVEVIEKSVTPEVARRYLQFDIKVSFFCFVSKTHIINLYILFNNCFYFFSFYEGFCGK